MGRVLERGDERAFGVLYDRYTPYLYGLALRLSAGDTAMAEETTHDAWVRAAARLDRFEWRSAFRTWLAGFVIRCASEAVRHGAPDMALSEALLETEDTALRGTAARVDLERALARLAPGFRHILVLHDVEGYTHDEIGQMLGIEAGTSKSQLSRARAAMRRALGETEVP